MIPEVRKSLLKNSLFLWVFQIVASASGFGFSVWFGTEYVKRLTAGSKHFDFYPWTYLFFNPMVSSRLNYMVLCLVFGIVGLLIYLVWTTPMATQIKKRMVETPPLFLLLSITFSGIMLAAALYFPRLNLSGSALVAGVPVFWFVYGAIARADRSLLRIGCPVLVLGLLLVSVEQFQLLKGPVFLMNEYADIYGKTKINGRSVSNSSFLQSLKWGDVDVINYFLELKKGIETPSQKRRSEIKPETLDSLKAFEQIDLESFQNYVTSFVSTGDGLEKFVPSSREGMGPTPYLERLKTLDVEALKQFYLANLVEHSHQNMGRGQVNHIGHILNPVNEYQLGKPLREIYLQYGLGNTFLMKWLMELFGGISYQNYYRTYLLYTVYYIFFLLMLVYLFRDSIWVLGAFTVVPVCFFQMGYIAYIVAPGILPSIHLMDAPTLIFLIAYFRRKNFIYFALAAISGLLGIVINGQFGMSLCAALLVSAGFYGLENKSGTSRYLWLVGLIVLLAASIGAWQLSSLGAINKVFPYHWAGLFSWPASGPVILLTIIYLVVSYPFLILLRNSRSELKYIFIHVFCYAQATLLYYYWSGLLNHLVPVLPFFWLQLFIMLRILRDIFLRNLPVWRERARALMIVFTITGLVILIPSAVHFYAEKISFTNNFAQHEGYVWRFDRASLVSTIPPGMMQESISLILKYSSVDKPAIFILSKYDGLLPFLAHRYSAMPFFELTSYLFSPKEYHMALQEMKTRKPEYLFVDTNIDQFHDKWSVLYERDAYYMRERASRLARCELLQHLFGEVRNEYEIVDQGQLISVYKRRKP